MANRIAEGCINCNVGDGNYILSTFFFLQFVLKIGPKYRDFYVKTKVNANRVGVLEFNSLKYGDTSANE